MSDSDPLSLKPVARRRAPPSAPSIVSGERELALEASAPRDRHVWATEGATRSIRADDQALAALLADDTRSATAPSLAFFETWPDVVLRFNSRQEIIYANAALERATALPRQHFLGRTLAEVEGFAPYAPLWQAQLDALLESHESRWFKFSYGHPTGVKLFDVRLEIDRDVLRDADSATAVWRDITVPRSALRASREADTFVATMLETAPFGVAMLDAQLRYREWNEYLEQQLGVRADETIGRRPDEIAQLAGNPEIMRELEAMRDGRLRTSQTAEYPFRGGRASEPTPWLRVRRTPVYDGRGDFRGVFITAERIDQQRFAETSLAALRQALDSAGEMVLEISRNGTIVDANETALAWTGFARNEIKGMLLAQIDASLTPERFTDMIEQLSGRGAWQGEARYRTRLGSEFPVDVVLQRVEVGVETGREFIYLLARDISDRKRVEARWAEAAIRFQSIFEDNPVPHILLDDTLRIAQCNRATGILLGYPLDELVGAAPQRFVPSTGHAAVQAFLAQLAADPQARAQTDLHLHTRDGRALSVKLTGRVVQPASQHASEQRQFLIIIEDYTERKASEDQLQVMLRDHRTLLETMSVGVAQTLHGKVVLANREFAQMFGFGDTDLTGMSLWDLCRDPANRMPHEVSGLPAVRAHETTGAEVVLFRTDGEPVWCLVQARPIEQRGGDEAIYTFQDISEIKRQREALSRSLLELNMVLDTTAVGVLHLAEGRVIRCNAQSYLLFGTDAGDLVGRRFADLFLSEIEYAERAAAPEGAGMVDLLSFEAQLRGREGRPFWGLVSLRAVDAQQRGAGQIASIIDIGARKRQEEQLQTLLAESQILFDTALVGLLFVRDGRAVRANTAMEELIASEPGALTDQIQLFAHPTDQLLLGGLAEHFDEIAREGTCEFELHMFRRRGDPLWVAVQGRAVNPERPELGYIFAFADIDERRRSERELRATLTELQLIFDNALVGMAYVADELVVKANAAAVRLFGYAPADLRELQISSLFADPGDWDEVRAQAASGADPGEDGVVFERLMRRSDDGRFWCAGNVRPLERGAPERGLMLALMDVDSRHKSEDELKRVRNYLDLVVEHLPVQVSVREAESGRFVSFNRAGEQMTGLMRDQVIGRTWHEIYGRQFADLYNEMDRRALASGTQVDRPRDVMLRADGRTLTVNQRVLPVFEPTVDEVPHARYVMSIIDDLTDEVRTEAALRETETRFRQFADNIDQLVFIATSDLATVLYVNSRYTSVVGGPADELLDDPRAALAHVHFDDAPRIGHLLPRLVAGLRRLRKAEFSVHIDHPSGGVRMLSVRLNPVRMFDGTVRVFGIAEDITVRAAAEQQRLDDAVKQRDILVREVHHRIKNNLQGVAGLLHQQAIARPELAATLNEAAAQIQAIAQVHGLQIRATGTLPVLGVVQGIFTNLSNMFGASVRFDTPTAALWRWGLPESEAVPLALVINELGTNAIKYRASRDQGVAVRLVSRAEGLELRIENQGQLKPGFDLGAIASSVSGLGLVKALLPRRGARLLIDQVGAQVVTRLELSAPAIGEELV